MKFFITIPHYSLKIPREVSGLLRIRRKHLIEIGEPGIDSIFDWPEVKAVKAQNHQCFPNLNRQRNDIDPITKMTYETERSLFPIKDFHGNDIYKKALTRVQKENLLKKYYDPFFKKIDRLITTGRYDFFIDVHAMNDDISSYNNAKNRPDICLGNRGRELADEKGNRYTRKQNNISTFPFKGLRVMREELKKNGYKCSLNHPFSGGYIVQKYAKQGFPGFQIEINKRLFMTSDGGEVISEKVKELKRCFLEALEVMMKTCEGFF